jgi:hypothetical protein
MPASTSHQSPFKKSSWLQTTKILAAALAQDKQIPSNRQVRQDARKEKQPQIDADERRLIVAFFLATLAPPGGSFCSSHRCGR